MKKFYRYKGILSCASHQISTALAAFTFEKDELLSKKEIAAYVAEAYRSTFIEVVVEAVSEEKVAEYEMGEAK